MLSVSTPRKPRFQPHSFRLASLAVLGLLLQASGPVRAQDCEPRIPLSQPAAFPIVIEQSGSYYFTQDIQGVLGWEGILVDARDVTIDLNGFTLSGPGPGIGSAGNRAVGTAFGVTPTPTPGPPATPTPVPQMLPHGISKVGPGTLTVRNGTIRGWSFGIHSGQEASLFVAEGLAFLSNRTGAVTAYGPARIHGCTSISGVLDAATSPTFHVGRDSLVTETVATGNSRNAGIAVGDSSIVTGCKVSSNKVGIWASSSCVISRSTATSNTAVGIEGSSLNRIEDNHVSGNGTGIRVSGPRNILFRNTAICNGPAGTQSYSFTLGNDVGPRGSAATITSPWANIEIRTGC